jgi:hypothetical protein
MKRFTGFAILGMMVWLFAGCVDVDTPKEINIGSSPPPRADCGRRPDTYNEAVDRWQALCDRNVYLEGQVERLREKYEEEKIKRKEYEKKYDRLKDRYEDD